MARAVSSDHVLWTLTTKRPLSKVRTVGGDRHSWLLRRSEIDFRSSQS
jgi:hypothetical protein